MKAITPARRPVFSYGWAVLGLCLLIIGWNAFLLWGVSKPVLIRYFPQLTPLVVPTLAASPESFSYPRLGIQAPLQNEPATSPLLQSDWQTLSKDLRQGIALSYPTQDYQQASYLYLTGHSSDTYPHPYSSIFASLNQAQVGDTFAITHQSVTHQYRVFSIKTVLPTDIQAFTPDPSQLHSAAQGPQLVYLVTCWPIFTTQKRLIVQAQAI